MSAIAMPFLATTGGDASSYEAVGSTMSEFASQVYSWLNILSRPDELLELLTSSSDDVTARLVLGVMVVIVGLLCVFNGYRWHKWVVVVLAFLIGLWMGHILSTQMGRSNVVAVAIGTLCAIVATPMLRVVVALFGGATGAFIGANAWTAFEAGPPIHWAGAAMGFIVIAMASFMLFRLVIVLFTSVGGAAMVVFGTLSVLLLVPDWQEGIRASLERNHLILPLLVTVAAVGGFVLQQSRVKVADEGGDGD